MQYMINSVNAITDKMDGCTDLCQCYIHSLLFIQLLPFKYIPTRKKGNPCHDLLEDPEAFVNHGDLIAWQLAHERVTTKTFSHCGFSLEITDDI